MTTKFFPSLLFVLALFVLALFTLLASSRVRAQGETTDDTGPSKLEIPRWAYGIRGGSNFTMMTLDPKPSEEANPLWLFALLGGLETRYSLYANLHLDAQLLYTLRYSRWEGTDIVDYSSNVYLQYLDLPLTVQWYPLRGQSQWLDLPTMGLEPYFFAGPQISYLLRGAHAVDFLELQGYYPEEDTVITDQLNPLEVSVLGGAGLRWHLSKHLTISGDVGVSIGLTDVNDSYLYQGKDYMGKNREVRWMLGVLYRP